MPTPTTRLGLLKPSTSDAFSTADLAANWQKLDDNPGIYVCTSATRPSWGTAQKGREIIETDTLLKWIWTGSSAAGGFVRAAPTGLLKNTGGAWARAQRTTAYSNSEASYKVMVGLSNVVIPNGRRTLMVIGTWPIVTNPNGQSAIGLFQSVTDGGATATGALATWKVSGDSSSAVQGATGSGGSYVTYIPGGLAAGVYNFSFQLYSYAGTSTAQANATTPLEISVIEI